ncbi:hypothetical protein TNCV_1150851 [Trichonephila clavipes]|nr:hypothetical protein TNCV_1150851 [Trichonephila clavipes]
MALSVCGCRHATTFVSYLNIDQDIIPVYHPQANPVLKENRDLKPRIAILVQNRHDEWEDKLPSIRFCFEQCQCLDDLRSSKSNNPHEFSDLIIHLPFRPCIDKEATPVMPLERKTQEGKLCWFLIRGRYLGTRGGV